MNVSHSVDTNTCKPCGLCSEICPAGIIQQSTSGEISFRPDRVELCVLCGHCMAICPTKSMHAGELSYDTDFFDLSKTIYDADAFSNFLASRRSVRVFKDTPVPHDTLEKLVDMISLSPMGFPPHLIEIAVVQNPEVMRKALPFMIKTYSDLVKYMSNPFTRFFMRLIVPKAAMTVLTNHVVPLMSKRLPYLDTEKKDIIMRSAPAMLLFHADRNAMIGAEDAGIYQAYGLLAAHSLGLGATAIGLVPPPINRSKELRKLLNIPEKHNVLACVILGYPKYTFRRGIRRNLAGVQWL